MNYYFYWIKEWIDDDDVEGDQILETDEVDVLQVIEDNITYSFSFEEYINFIQTVKNSTSSAFNTAFRVMPHEKIKCSFKEIDILTKQEIVDGSTGLKDKLGNTILHYFALRNVQRVLEHPNCNVVQNDFGLTPLKCMVTAGYDCSTHPDYETVKIKPSKKNKPEFIEDDSNVSNDHTELLSMLFPEQYKQGDKVIVFGELTGTVEIMPQDEKLKCSYAGQFGYDYLLKKGYIPVKLDAVDSNIPELVYDCFPNTFVRRVYGDNACKKMC